MKKRNYLFLYVLLGFVACTGEEFKNEVIDNDKSQSNLYDPNHRSYAEAVEIAQNSIEILKSNISSTRGQEPARTLNLKNGVKAICNKVTRSDGSTSMNDTLLYIFNFNDNRGFAVVSASRQTDGLMAVVEFGSYDPDVSTGNPGFDNYMRMAESCIAYEDKTPIDLENNEICKERTRSPMYHPLYDTIYYKKIDPKIAVKWGQEGRLGQYCPNGISGCSNTASAQIMSYFKYPYSLNLTYSGRDVNYTTLDWTDICVHEYTYCYYNRDAADKQIGRLARQLGQLAGSNYSNSSFTSTNISNMRSAIQSLGYSVGSVTDYDYIIQPGVYDWDAGYTLANLLSEGKLIYMRGSNSDDDGHAWVIDGCYYVKCKYNMMVTYDGGATWTIAYEMATYRTCLNHINWGWDGAQNGYFNGWVFNAYNYSNEDDPNNRILEGQNVNFYNNIRYFTIIH